MKQQLRLIERSRRCGKAALAGRVARCTALADRLAGLLEAGVTKRALAEMAANRAVVAGVMDGKTDNQVEADLRAEARRYEEVAALRRFGRPGKGAKHGD